MRQRDPFQCLHQVAEDGALGAARGLHLLLQFLLIVGLALRAHDHHGKLLVVIDAGDDIVGQQHVLVEEIAEREIFRVVAYGHGGDDLLRVEEDGQRPLDRHPRLDLCPGLVDAADTLREARIGRIGGNEVVVLRHGANVGEARTVG